MWLLEVLFKMGLLFFYTQTFYTASLRKKLEYCVICRGKKWDDEPTPSLHTQDHLLICL